MSAPGRSPAWGGEQGAGDEHWNVESTAAVRLGAADALVAGILDLAAARSLALDALLSVSGVEWSSGITTACVECTDHPRILLNPGFVERCCGTRERLAMLVLHELSHISLGHTRLYPRPTAAHNLAFDALINAGLLTGFLRRGMDPEPYAALPVGLYGPDEPPWFLLRPPPGWPDRPDWQASAGCPCPLREIHARLYSASSGSSTGTGSGLLEVTYGEIIAALSEAGLTGCADSEEAVRILRRLLGAHGATNHERGAQTSGRDARAGEALARTMSALGLDRGLGAGPGGEPYTVTIARRVSERALEQALAKLLRRVFVEESAASARWYEEAVPTVSADPTRDRRAATRRMAARAFGAPAPLLFRAESLRRRPERRGALVYLDVSGSMEALLERLHAALIPLRRLLAAQVHVFSTEVVPLARGEFVRGTVRTTGGTAIEPVLRHVAELAGAPRGRRRRGVRGIRALVLTDGYFDPPSPDAVRALRSAGGEIHLGVPGGGPLHDRASWVASATRLPDSPDPTR